MNKKAEVYQKFLEENKINWSDVFEVPKADEVPEESFMHPVVFRSAIGIQGQNLPTIYVMLQVRVGAGLVKEANKAAVLEHLNALNENYKVFKYYADEAGNIIIESCIPSTDDQFVPQMIHAVIDVIVDHLNSEYPKLMKAVWAE